MRTRTLQRLCEYDDCDAENGNQEVREAAKTHHFEGIQAYTHAGITDVLEIRKVRYRMML